MIPFAKNCLGRFALMKKWFADRYVKSYINRFVAEYVTWLTEMQNNKRGFAPFELGENRNAVFSLVKGCETKKYCFVWIQIMLYSMAI